jgi:hypothetical protein
MASDSGRRCQRVISLPCVWGRGGRTGWHWVPWQVERELALEEQRRLARRLAAAERGRAQDRGPYGPGTEASEGARGQRRRRQRLGEEGSAAAAVADIAREGGPATLAVAAATSGAGNLGGGGVGHAVELINSSGTDAAVEASRIEAAMARLLPARAGRQRRAAAAAAAELVCGVCLELYSDPWRGDCGHALCRSCLSLLRGSPPRCPICRAPLAEVASLAEVAEQLCSPPRRAAGAGGGGGGGGMQQAAPSPPPQAGRVQAYTVPQSWGGGAVRCHRSGCSGLMSRHTAAAEGSGSGAEAAAAAAEDMSGGVAVNIEPPPGTRPGMTLW